MRSRRPLRWLWRLSPRQRLCRPIRQGQSDEQRVNPGLLIADADQRVYFDGNSKLFDKSDAKWAFVLTADSKEAFEEEYPDKSDMAVKRG
jgi:hypothetical protein